MFATTTLHLNEPMSWHSTLDGQRRTLVLDKFVCERLAPGEEPPNIHFAMNIAKATHTDNGEPADLNALLQLRLDAGFQRAMADAFDQARSQHYAGRTH